MCENAWLLNAHWCFIWKQKQEKNPTRNAISFYFKAHDFHTLLNWNRLIPFSVRVTCDLAYSQYEQIIKLQKFMCGGCNIHNGVCHIHIELKREIFTQYRGKCVRRAPRHVIKRTLTSSQENGFDSGKPRHFKKTEIVGRFYTFCLLESSLEALIPNIQYYITLKSSLGFHSSVWISKVLLINSSFCE